MDRSIINRNGDRLFANFVVRERKCLEKRERRCIMPVMSAVHCVVHGRVQGVGFRFFVLHEARALGVSGWVRNLPSGEVEVRASGNEEDLRALIRLLEEGPALARVDKVEIEWDGQGSNELFHIR